MALASSLAVVVLILSAYRHPVHVFPEQTICRTESTSPYALVLVLLGLKHTLVKNLEHVCSAKPGFGPISSIYLSYVMCNSCIQKLLAELGTA